MGAWQRAHAGEPTYVATDGAGDWAIRHIVPIDRQPISRTRRRCVVIAAMVAGGWPGTPDVFLTFASGAACGRSRADNGPVPTELCALSRDRRLAVARALIALAADIWELNCCSHRRRRRRPYTPARLTMPIAIDGQLTEAAWESADAIDDFRQTDPVEGAALERARASRCSPTRSDRDRHRRATSPTRRASSASACGATPSSTSEDHVRIVLGPFARRPIRLRVRREPERRALRRR